MATLRLHEACRRRAGCLLEICSRRTGHLLDANRRLQETSDAALTTCMRPGQFYRWVGLVREAPTLLDAAGLFTRPEGGRGFVPRGELESRDETVTSFILT